MPEMTAELEVGTKRTMESNENEIENDVTSNKIARSGDLESRLLLHSTACGGVIGKKGETITRLRNNYNVMIKMASTQTADRTMTINGTLENCVGVIKEVLVHSSAVPYPTTQLCSMELDLLIPKDAIGTIVGKAGARVTELRETTCAKIKIYKDCLPRSNERVVAVGGDSEEQVLAAVRGIYRLLLEMPAKVPVQYYVPESLNKANAMAPLAPWPQQQGGFDNMNRNMSLMKGSGHMMNSVAQPLMDAPVTVGGTEGGNQFLQLQTTTTINASSAIVGAIIGKGGTRIREIRNNSGCKISFTEMEEKDVNGNERIITLSGTQQQVQTAEQLMAQYMCHMSV